MSNNKTQQAASGYSASTTKRNKRHAAIPQVQQNAASDKRLFRKYNENAADF